MNNLVKNNCFWATNPNKYYNENGGILPGAVGFEAYNNVIADPEYVDCQAKNFRLQEDSLCQSILEVAPLPLG